MFLSKTWVSCRSSSPTTLFPKVTQRCRLLLSCGFALLGGSLFGLLLWKQHGWSCVGGFYGQVQKQCASLHPLRSVIWPGSEAGNVVGGGGKGAGFDEHAVVSIIILLVIITYCLLKITQFCATVLMNCLCW